MREFLSMPIEIPLLVFLVIAFSGFFFGIGIGFLLGSIGREERNE